MTVTDDGSAFTWQCVGSGGIAKPAGCHAYKGNLPRIGPSPTGPMKLGAYLGDPGNPRSGTVDLYNGFVAAWGQPPVALDVYVDGSQGPISTWSGRYPADGMKNNPITATMIPVVGIPMVAKGDNAATDFSAIAAGTYDSTFIGIFDSFKNDDYPVIYVRFGWEFNGNWMAWSVTSDTVSQWNAAWLHLARLAHSYQGMKIYTVWNPGAGKLFVNFNDAYPGDDAVDVISIDIYGVEAGGTPDSQALDTGGGNDFSILAGMAMAYQHGKPFSYSETGAGTDNTTFPASIAAAVASSPYKPPIAFMNLWICACAGNSSLLWTGNPTTIAAWKNAVNAVSTASGGYMRAEHELRSLQHHGK